MPAWRKRLWALGCLGGPGLILAVNAVVWSLYLINGAVSDSTQIPLLVPSYLGLAVYLAALVAAFLHVRGRAGFSGKQKRNWYLGLFFLNALLLPYFWWKLIRPLPTDADDQFGRSIRPGGESGGR